MFRVARFVGRNMGQRGSSRSLQLRILGFGLRQDRNIAIGVFPEREEILIRNVCLGLISRHRERSAELQVRHRADWVGDNNSRMIENFFKFRCGFSAAVLDEVRLAAHIDRIKRSEEPTYSAGWHA
jgi:hypothetical protein